jgi:hypothetical protein
VLSSELRSQYPGDGILLLLTAISACALMIDTCMAELQHVQIRSLECQNNRGCSANAQ